MGVVPDKSTAANKRRFPFLALIVWAVLAFALPSVVEPLNLGTVVGFPIGFFLVAQGTLIAFLLIAIASARRQDRRTRDETGNA